MPKDLPTRESLAPQMLRHLALTLGTTPEAATTLQWRMALTHAVRDRVTEAWMEAQRAAREAGAKRVHYLSMEFLIGRLLEDAVTNMRLTQAAEAGCAELGLRLADLYADEPDAALGNGGLGRLAACFLESMATLRLPAFGYGIRYEHGLFRQSFEDHAQVEEAEDWLDYRHAWEFERPETRVSVGFGGHVVGGAWTPHESVRAAAFDTPIAGWNGQGAATLRLWQARADVPFDLGRFNSGDHVGAAEAEARARAISRVLYPDDTSEAGRELRLRQEYFFTAASLRDILVRFDAEHGGKLDLLPEKVAIQLNDTHPAIAGPELVRLLVDERGLDVAEGIALARACLSYTNHTLLPEALERWHEGLMGRLLPRHLEIIGMIDDAHYKANTSRAAGIWRDGHILMGDMAFVMARRVNGVSALHTELMKETVFEDLHTLHPERIVNQTNGVTPRRWLNAANPRLASLYTEAMGSDDWVDDLERLAELEPMVEDAAFAERFAAIKTANKAEFADWLAETQGVRVDPSAMFDVQIKRMHEYKRQHLNLLETIALWQEMKDAPDAGWTPRVKLFAGKAAPGYGFAKEIIRAIGEVGALVNSDPDTGHLLQVAFLPNYNVTLAERLIPAADLSEQISTAGKEASGTGNMKFALSGAPTVGTLDGANVEIRQHVGAENFFLFGMTADEVFARRRIHDHAARAIAADGRLARALDALGGGTFDGGEGRHAQIAGNIRHHDPFLVASDFTDYWRAQREADAAYLDRDAWVRMAMLNALRSGWFSSDRTIRGYMAEVWGAAAL